MSNALRSTRARLDAFTSSKNCYDILGLTSEATLDDIKRRYRQLAMEYHPDRHHECDRARAQQVFVSINEAYHRLCTPDKRLEYDSTLASRRADSSQTASSIAIDPLQVILEDILRYVHIFDDSIARRLPARLRETLLTNLDASLNERIVGALFIADLKKSVSYRGHCESIHLVITNLCLRIVFESKHYSALEQAEYVYCNLQTIPIYAISAVRLGHADEVHKGVSVVIETDERVLDLDLLERNCAKLILVLGLWGVPVVSADLADRRRDLRLLVREALVIGGGVVLGLGMLGLLPMLLFAELRWTHIPYGESYRYLAIVLPIGMFAVALNFGKNMRQWMRVYRRKSLRELLDSTRD